MSNASSPNLYRAVVMDQVPRLLGLLDRAPASPTYGCFDRNYWHLKLVTDFPGATYQQAVLSLAWLATLPGDRAGMVESDQTAEWARAAMRFWASIQNRDGSFNEWYAQEHSYCPTAFTAFAVSEALLLLRERLPAGDATAVGYALERAGRWLAQEYNGWVANQNMAALNALHNIWLITANKEFREAAERKLALILRGQDAEGWFPEYGGADAGYTLVATDLLAHYWTKTNDARVYDALDRLLRFLSSLIQPDGSVADCGSRATQHVLPYGLELLAHAGHQPADQILSGLHAAIAAGRGLTPSRVDDRYFAYFYINSYVGAFCACSGGHREWNGAQKTDTVYRNAGLGVFSRGSRTAVVSFKRNNLLRVFINGTLAYSDAGYLVGLDNKGQGVSCGFDPKQTWSMSGDDELLCVRTSGGFYGSPPAQWLVLPLKMWGTIALRSAAVAAWFNKWLKSREVAAPRRVPLILEREVRIERAVITVTDHIVRRGPVKVTHLSPIEEGNVTYSPSAGYYTSRSAHRLGSYMDADALTALFVSRGEVRVTKTLTVDGRGETTLKVEWQ